ncbi:MAG TPA: response regulator [Thermoanaerobaculia bacterium]|nr:response regulator [Thermoanaerobaculia bacterium]
MTDRPPVEPTVADAAAGPGDDATARAREQRILMLARVGQDEALAERALAKAGYELMVHRDGEEIAAEIEAGAGALIVSSEALTPEHLGHLIDALEHQPPWSDLPVLALPQEDSASARWTAQAMERLGNVIVLERPLRNAMLLSAVKSALRDRARQYRFREMMSRLDEVERRRHQFLVDLGHEVRNPLAVIRTALGLLRELDDDEARRRQPIELIERQSDQLARLIDDLLQVTRFNVGRLALQRTATDLAEVVETTLASFSLLAKAGGGELDLEVDAGEVPVSADPVSLEQMIFHLVRGAVRDTRPGERARLAVQAEENHAVLSVTAGAGGEGEGESELAQSLPIVRNLAELHGGRVEVRQEGELRHVEVRLPRRAHPGVRRRTKKRRPGAPLSVLVVEDSPDGREGLTTLLELKQYRVTSAGGGKEALAKVDKAKPEVALVDIGLPDMDGYEVARELRRRFNSQLTLIALTGYGQPDDRRKALEAGFDLHLVKPVDPQQLFDLLGDIAAGPEG